MEKEKFLKSAHRLCCRVFGHIMWDMNDADFSSKPIIMTEEDFFNDDTLLNVLAFVTTSPDFKGFDGKAKVFGNYLTEHDGPDEESIEIARWGVEATEEYLESSTGLIVQYLCEKGLVADCTDDGYPHSVVELKLFYLDNDEKLHRIDLNPIRESWKKLEYKEILKQINLKCIDFFKE